MRLALLAAFGLALGLVTPALAASSSPTNAFEQAFATSLYVFDACGDGAAGQMFRRALAAKMQQCSIPDDAMKHYRLRTAYLLQKERERMDKIIEERGSVPNRVEGMAVTCHENRTSPAYVQMRDKLNAYSEGRAKPDAILPGDCDAASFTPLP